MKVLELFETVLAAGEVMPITVTANNGSFTVGTTAKSGPTLDVIFKVWDAFDGKRGVTTKSKAGLELNAHRMLKNRPNGFVIKFDKPEGMKEKIEATVEKMVASIQKQVKSNAAYKAKAPERKKEASKANAEYHKAELAGYAEKYGKGTWGRVTYKQEGGDDGYSYVVRVDGRPKWNGLTQREAMHYKTREVDDIAKKEKLGQYAKTA